MSIVEMKYEHKSKVFITGSNASGTSFMCLLLHYLGLDCGYGEEEFNKEMMKDRGKGVEYLTDKYILRELHSSRERGYDISPLLIKKPFMPNWDEDKQLKDPESKTVFDFAREYNWDIKYIVITIRKFDNFLKAIRRSEILTRHEIRDKFKDDVTTSRWVQNGLYRVVEEIASKDIPFSLVSFPKLTEDPDYLYSKIEPIIDKSYEDFLPIYNKLVRPELVHVK
jgi:hypothetical protein